MARYEHLPIFRDAYDLTVHVEKLVRGFGRYHKYTLGTDLRNKTRAVLDTIVEANNSNGERGERLEELRKRLESLKVLNRLCHDSEAFSGGTRSYLHVAERITGLAKQNEGWIKATRKQRAQSEEDKDFGAVGHGRNREG
ncbi:MAG: four helix bundle protein [Verrucomicrobia bacterium]|jgi:hypothetical protein|nr:four helix bundle protein [Verrucomicrobiota bacterium]